MNPPVTTYLDEVGNIADEIISRHADDVDRQGRFPRESIAALAGAGLLGLIIAPEVGGMGLGPGAAAFAVERVARACGSTAMVLAMHYAGTAVLEQYASKETRREAAAGRHLSTLAFSEAGSRSHFWAPTSTAQRRNGSIAVDAKKSWVTTAGNATAYVWSSRPTQEEGLSSLWLVPSGAPGLSMPDRYDGLGLRGNDSRPVTASGVELREEQRLGKDGEGFAIMMSVVLPTFSLMNAGFSLGLMEAAVQRTAEHASGVRYTHLDSTLADLPTIRAYIARMRIKTDLVRSFLHEAVAAVEEGREEAMLRVLEIKAAAAESALEVLALAMRVCGGAAYRREVGVERLFRDGQAAVVMAPTTDQLYDFIGKAVCGQPLF